MASESSSAVLELNDADITEDTEPPSVTDDANDGIPLIMEHGYDIAVKVDAPVKQLSTLETFVTYRVRCVCARWPTPPSVRRRYNHFRVLHKRLSLSQPLRAAPPLPPLHSARQQLDRYSAAFVAVRTRALHAFLDRVAKHPIFTHSEDFRIFLTTPDDELDKIFKNENSALNLWGLSSALSSGTEKPVNGARVKDPEFTSAADYLTSLQQKLTALCALTVKLHKGSTALAHELMGGGHAVAACTAGAHAAHAARARSPAPLHARATLPLLAAHAAAHAHKITSRDAVHAAYVAGNNATGDLHNRLEQASEALRSELSDWIPKTRAEIKSILLEIADRQVAIHTQTLMGWEHALKLSTETNAAELFKTVSKTAVQNLSPSKCITPTETERDFEDLESSDSELSKENTDFEVGKDIFEVDVKVESFTFEDVTSEDKVNKFEGSNGVEGRKDSLKSRNEVSKDSLKSEVEVSKDSLTSDHEVSKDSLKSDKEVSNSLKSTQEVSNSLKSDNEVSNSLKSDIEVINSLKSDLEVSNSLKSDLEVSSDPLRDFSEVDLSS